MTQQDPIGLAGGLNLYGFAQGDPVNFSDPFGLCKPWPECWYQAAASWGARRGGVVGTIVLHMASAGSGYAEAFGVNELGAQLSAGDTRGALATAAMMFVSPGRGSASSRSGRLLRNVDGGTATADEALAGARRWLGEGYSETSSGVFRSADNSRQFRMTASDLMDPKAGPHVHFEAIGADGRTITQNAHVRLTPAKK